MGRNDVVRAGIGLLAVAGLVLTTAGACGGGGDTDDQAPPANQAPASVPPGDGVPNDGDGDADG